MEVMILEKLIYIIKKFGYEFEYKDIENISHEELKKYKNKLINILIEKRIKKSNVIASNLLNQLDNYSKYVVIILNEYEELGIIKGEIFEVKKIIRNELIIYVERREAKLKLDLFLFIPKNKIPLERTITDTSLAELIETSKQTINQNKKKNISWNNSKSVFKIACERWQKFIFSLPPVYTITSKKKVIKEFGLLSGIFTYRNLLTLRKKDILTYDTYLEYSEFFKNSTNLPVKLISLLPIFLVEILRIIAKINSKILQPQKYFNKIIIFFRKK